MQELIEMLKSGLWIVEGMNHSFENKEPPERVSSSGIEIFLRGKPSPDMVADLRQVLSESPGMRRVYFMVESGGTIRRIETEYTVNGSEMIIERIASIVGKEQVRLSE